MFTSHRLSNTKMIPVPKITTLVPLRMKNLLLQLLILSGIKFGISGPKEHLLLVQNVYLRFGNIMLYNSLPIRVIQLMNSKLPIKTKQKLQFLKRKHVF